MSNEFMLGGIVNPRKIYNPMKFMDPLEPLHVRLNLNDFKYQTIYFPNSKMDQEFHILEDDYLRRENYENQRRFLKETGR